MEERGECSASASAHPSDEIWAKFAPSDKRYSDVEIRSDEKVISSEISATSNDKHCWCKIVRNPDLCSATMENKSQNTILVDGGEVHSDKTIVIKDGSLIIPGPDREEFVSYRFHIMSSPDICQSQLKICVDADHAKCSICLNIWHDVVTVAPCLHNFCNGCFSEWLRRSKQRHSAVLCPQCRSVVHFVGKNHFLRTIAEDMLRADSSLRRSHDEVALLDTYAIVRSNLVIGSGKKSRKRAYTPMDDQRDDTDHQCPQCVTEVGGFRCEHGTVHLQCQACGGMMPSRTDFGIPQYCSGCERPFCGAYWHALGVTGNGSHPVCSQDTLRPISEHSISTIPLLAHEKNLQEQITNGEDIARCDIRVDSKAGQQRNRLSDKFAFPLTVIEKYASEFLKADRTRMMLNHADTITAQTFVCCECYHKLVSFLLYWFRISTPKYLLPPEASAREDCWYGYACRTQHRSVEHARKRNHVCRPTRGSNM